jgi:hypothetical protein
VRGDENEKRWREKPKSYFRIMITQEVSLLLAAPEVRHGGVFVGGLERRTKSITNPCPSVYMHAFNHKDALVQK